MRTALSLVLLGLLLTACQVRVEERIEVSEDGSGSIALVTLFDEEAEEMVTFGMGMENLESTVGADAPGGFTVEAVSEGELQGFSARAEFSALSEASGLAEQLSDEGGLGEITLKRADDSIVFRLDLPQDRLGTAGGDFEALGEFGDLSALTEGMEEFIQIRFSAVLPGEIVYTNADSVSGGTAEWVIDPFGTRTQLYATSQPASGFGALWMWVVVGLGLGAMVAGLGALHRRRRTEPIAVDTASEGELSGAGSRS
jgi:hypothetical protein